METITDENSSDLFLLKNLKPPTRVSPEHTQDPSAHKSTDNKQEELRTDDLDPDTDQFPPLTTVQPKTSNPSAEQPTLLPIILLDDQEETNCWQLEKRNQNTEILQKKLSAHMKKKCRTKNWKLRLLESGTKSNLFQGSSKSKPTGMPKRKTYSPVKSPPPQKTSELHIRHNNRPIRTRQPLSLSGDWVSLSLVEDTDDRPDDHSSTYNKTPTKPLLVAVSIVGENTPVTVADSTTSNNQPWGIRPLT